MDNYIKCNYFIRAIPGRVCCLAFADTIFEDEQQDDKSKGAVIQCPSCNAEIMIQ
jgi:hypothetical protein